MAEKLTKEEWVQKYEQAFERAQQTGGGKDPRWQGVTCPKNDKKDCLLCDLAWPIIAKKNRDKYSQELVDKGFELLQKSKFFANVVRKEEPDKVIILEFPTTVFKKLFNAQVEADEGGNKDFASYKNGKNVVIIKTGKDRNTEYDVRFRERSKFPDSFGKKAWDLSNIESLRNSGKAPILRAVQLEEGPNEMRFLPHWELGETMTGFFWIEWLHHMGITQEDFDRIQRGEFNPFAEAIFDEETKQEPVVPGEVDVPMFADEVTEKEEIEDAFGPKEYGDTREAQADDGPAGSPTRDEATAVAVDASPIDHNLPACVGSFDTDDEECSKDNCPHSEKCLKITRGE